MNPKLTRLMIAFAVVSLGCQDPEYGGEKGTLRLRFGLGGCTSVAASKSTLARGGSNELLVGDKKLDSLRVEAASPAVVATTKSTLSLECTTTQCNERQATLPLDALTTGSGRIVFTDANGGEVDALTINVAEATSISVVDKDGHNAASFKLKDGGQLQAKLTGANGEVFAKTPFTWSVEGEVLKPIISKDSVVGVEANSTGTSLVNVRFGELSGSIEVKITN